MPVEDPYENRSYFADLLEVASSERSAAAAFDGGVRLEGDTMEVPKTGARARLLALQRANDHQSAADIIEQTRRRQIRDTLDMLGMIRNDMTTSSTDGGEFVPVGAPTRVREAFAGAVRARSIVARLLDNQPLPEFGSVVEEPRISTGPSVALHTENATVDETDMVTELENPPVRTIAGQVDLSRQAFERSSPELDQVIAAELGTAYAELIDSQIVAGNGTGQELTGLLNVTGITAVTYVDGTPTVAEAWPKIMETLSTTATAWKNTTPVVLVHLRRLAWLFSAVATPPTIPPGVRFVSTASIPTDLGAGTEDAVIVLDPSAIKLYSQRPKFRIYLDSGSATATARVQAYGYVALNAARQPKAIGKLTGTGLAAPTFA